MCRLLPILIIILITLISLYVSGPSTDWLLKPGISSAPDIPSDPFGKQVYNKADNFFVHVSDIPASTFKLNKGSFIINREEPVFFRIVQI